jgi:LPS sulfotransferase NodH
MADNEVVSIPLQQPSQPWIDRAKLSLWWQKLRREVRRQRYWWLRPHEAYQPVFILATCRSGSNLLLDYLRQLPGVAGHSELLCPLLPIGPWRERLTTRQAIMHIRRSLQSRPAPIRACKLMLHQLQACHVSLRDLDRAFPEALYFILYRQSLAEQFVSQKLAETTKQWLLLPGEEQKQPRLVIQPRELRDYCAGIRAAYAPVLEHPGLAARSAIVTYEELTHQPAACLRQAICPLLGLPALELQTNLRKQNTQHLATRIANYSQVAALLTSPLCHQHYEWPEQRTIRPRLAA